MHIAILTGGISTEREVALRSGTNMLDWVKKSGHTGDLFDFPSELDEFLEKYKTYDFIIPVFHGIYGEDGQITAFLETLGCRYAYSSFGVHSFCIDKYRTNLLVEKIGIKIPKSFFVARGYFITEISSPLVCYPLIIKPIHGGSSINIQKVESRNGLIEAQQMITGDDIIIQECIDGREFTVGVYKTQDGYSVLPIVEICVDGDTLFDYTEKYETDGSNEVFVDLPVPLRKSLEEMSILIASVLECRGVVRMDWRYNGKDFYFLEVNTIPGFTSGSLVPKMWKKAGKSEKEYIDMLRI